MAHKIVVAFVEQLADTRPTMAICNAKIWYAEQFEDCLRSLKSVAFYEKYPRVPVSYWVRAVVQTEKGTLATPMQPRDTDTVMPKLHLKSVQAIFVVWTTVLRKLSLPVQTTKIRTIK